MNGFLDPEFLIIGFGKGGKAVAATLGRLGHRVVLVEQSERMYGGTCPNIGCIPSKGLVYRSNKRRPTDDAREFYEHAVGEVQAIRDVMRRDNVNTLNALASVTVVTGRAVFIDPHTVDVDAGGQHLTIRGETILLNLGAQPIVPDIPGLRASKHVVTSTELMETTLLPERLVIIGGGPLGLEFAGIYRHFGSQVTLVEAAPRILDDQDEDVAAAVEEILVGDGVELIVGARVLEVRDGPREANIVYEKDGRQHELDADTILVAVGRAPAVRDVGLEAACVRLSEHGAVEVDEYLRTSQPHIYAVGDDHGRLQNTYISLDDGRIVLDQVVAGGQRSTTDRVAVPHTIFTTPPLATVGVTEREARDAGYRVKIASQPVADIAAMPRAYAVGETRGLMKFVIDADTDDILGAALLSVDAQELINTVAIAMRHGIKSADLGDAIYTHPSSTEAFNDLLATERSARM